MPERVNYQAEVEAFLQSHSRYQPTENNLLRIEEFLENADLPLSSESLEIAYVNLVARGELELKDPEPPVVTPRRREFICYRNGRPLSGDVRPL
jgi:hypothetical protein